MSILQNVGIAMQAGDAYRRADLEEAGTMQRLKAGQSALDEAELYRQVEQMAIEHMMQKDAAERRAKKEAVKKPAVTALVPVSGMPFATPAYTYGRGGSNDPGYSTGMANGGEVPPKVRFRGVYDDMQVSAGMPRTFMDYLEDRKKPDFNHDTNVQGAIESILGHARAMANGGEVKRKTKSLYTYCKESHRVGNSAAVKLKHGGPVKGPGTGTSDSVKAVGPGGAPYRLSTGEYVLSADTVKAVGKHKLDDLQARFHKRV